MKNVMVRAWEIYRHLEGDHLAKIAMALRMAWAEIKADMEKEDEGEILGGKIATITEKSVSELMEMGAKRWTKAGRDRLYINAAGASIIGLEVERYKTGNVCSASLDGEGISHSAAYRVMSAYSNAYIDLSTGALEGVSGSYADLFREKIQKYLKKSA